jgi:cystathionine beta-lyase/cystathionine gamma-synthase
MTFQEGKRVLVGTKPEHAETFRFVQKCTGGILSPFDSYLLLRGVKTLAVRMEQHDANGRVVADFLAGKLGAAKVFATRLKLCYLAESLGGVETLICHPATMTHAAVGAEGRAKLGITDGLMRISVGIEDVGDILADLEQAMRG